MDRKLGIYLHVPFCNGKCPYCDFYSVFRDEELMDRYVRRMTELVKRWGTGEKVSSVYFGGGTPSLLGTKRLCELLRAVKQAFSLSADGEVTVEMNPASRGVPEFFPALREAGFNRLSIGVQSANEDELRLLGRKHTARDAAFTVEAAKEGGFSNISLDMMLGLPGGSREKLQNTIDFFTNLDPTHISAYLLKVEEGTPFFQRGVEEAPEERACEEYLFCVEEFSRRGYGQYEISNFAKPGMESRHNLLYWHGEEYLGFGPGAHSFYKGKRFYFPRNLEGFLKGGETQSDGEGGGFSEYAMLNLRLCEGLRRERCLKRFPEDGEGKFLSMLERARRLPGSLVQWDEKHIALTPDGFLVSNEVIGRLLGF